MKKLVLLGAFLLSVFSAHSAFSYARGSYGYSNYGSGYGYDNTGACGEEATGECYCKYVCYQPCYYNTYRCYDECYPVQRTCCRYVPQYYQVQKCRYVPQYYCETACRQVPEYYCVTDYKTCRKTVCEPQCTYIPRYYWKHSCENRCPCP